MISTYQPTSTGSSIVALVFYILMAIFIIYSLFAIYALLRYGRTRILGIVISLLYLIIAASIYLMGANNLNHL
jgi:hypothetical protein